MKTMQKLMKGLLAVAITAANFLASAQAPVKQWDNTIGGSSWDSPSFTSSQQTADGGYIVGGRSISPISGDKSANSRGGYDYWVVKLDASGTKVWDKTYGGNQFDFLNAIIQTSDGGYLLGGESFSPVSGDKTTTRRGQSDYWVVKLDAAGTKMWDKTLGGSGFDILYSVQQTDDGGYVLGGYSNSNAGFDKSENMKGSSGDYWLIKLDAVGTKMWDKTFGGSSSDALYSVQRTSDGGYILGGTSNSNISFDKSENTRGPINTTNDDYWVVKTDANGNKIWDKTIGGYGLDGLRSIKQTVDNGYLLAGYSFASSGYDKTAPVKGIYDYWVVKLNSTGSKIWDKTYGSTGDDLPSSLSLTNDGGFVINGYSNSNAGGDKTQNRYGTSYDYWVVKADGLGIKQWDITLGGTGDDFGLGGISQTADGGYFLSGYSNSLASGDKSENNIGGSNDYWVVKLGTALNTQDTQLPVISGIPINGIQQNSDAGRCGAVVTWTGISATDNVAVTSFTYSTSPTGFTNGAEFPVGTTTVTYTATDAAGNTTTASFVVVISDNQAPTITGILPGGSIGSVCMSAAPSAPGVASIEALYADNCSAVTATLLSSSVTGTDCSWSATYTYSIKDATNNAAAHAVVNYSGGDTSAPSFTGPDDILIYTDTNCEYNASPSVTGDVNDEADNCSTGLQATFSDAVEAGVCAGNKVITRTWSLIDNCGNAANTQVQTITVSDNTLPVIATCVPSVTIATDHEGCTALLPDYRNLVSTSDNCGDVSLTQSPAVGSALPLGANAITISATDGCGNTSICEFSVMVIQTVGGAIATSNSYLYFGYTGDQTATITAYPTGGTAPYTVSITMVSGESLPTARVDGQLLCNVISASGDEVWTSGANTSSTVNACGVQPVSTSNSNIGVGGSYSVNVSLMADARFVATITDANNCSYTIPYDQAARVDAEDVRCFAGSSAVQKVQICHRTGNSKNPCAAICVVESAVDEHIAHGDFYGKCTTDCAAPNANARIAGDVNDADVDFTLEAYPNPFKSTLSVQVSNPDQNEVVMHMMDLTGRNMYLKIPAPSEDGIYVLETIHVQPGLYFMRINIGKFTKTIKLLKE